MCSNKGDLNSEFTAHVHCIGSNFIFMGHEYKDICNRKKGTAITKL